MDKSGVTGQAMKETQHINKSLSSLGDVMEGLDKKSKHIPYRNSKLTYLLQVIQYFGFTNFQLLIIVIMLGFTWWKF